MNANKASEKKNTHTQKHENIQILTHDAEDMNTETHKHTQKM